MNTSSFQLQGSQLNPQQLLAMVNAQIATNASATVQSQALTQSGAMTQAQAGGQSSAMVQAQFKTKFSSKGKARAKGAKFYHLHPNSKNYGAQATAAMMPKKATRPLNSFMAFRSYYSKIFRGFQQKNISGYLTVLWKADPFKAKWAILAKAFSEIRDVKGKSDALLTEFLDINAAFIRIVEPDRYLGALGWELGVDAEAKMSLRQKHNFDITSIGNDLLTTNVSVADVVENCYQHRYIARDGAATNPHGNGQVMVMASSAQPAAPDNQSSGGNVLENTANGESIASTNDVNDNSHQGQQVNDGSTTHISNASSAAQDLGITDADGNTNADDFLDMASTFGISDNHLSGDGAGASETTPVNVDFSVVDEHVGTYPHNLAFDPDSTNNYVFDPFQGDGFDAFDMSNIDAFTMDDWMAAPAGFVPEFEDNLFEF